MVQLMSLGGTRGGSRDVEGLVLVQQQHVLWSTLTPAEGAAVHSLAATALLHPQSPGQRSAAGEARCGVRPLLQQCFVGEMGAALADVSGDLAEGVAGLVCGS